MSMAGVLTTYISSHMAVNNLLLAVVSMMNKTLHTIEWSDFHTFINIVQISQDNPFSP